MIWQCTRRLHCLATRTRQASHRFLRTITQLNTHSQRGVQNPPSPYRLAFDETPPEYPLHCHQLRLQSLHDTVLKRYRVAAGSARPLRDYLPLRDFSIIHDYRLPRDPSYYATFPSFTTTAYSTIPLAIWLPESRAARSAVRCVYRF